MGKPIVWTFHDTRIITARCASFEEDQCNQWQTGCKKCTPNAIYLPSKINNVAYQWKLKKKWLNAIEKLTIVTPSQWLANHVKNSYLKEKPCLVINNGIDTSEFSKSFSMDLPVLKDFENSEVSIPLFITKQGFSFKYEFLT